MKRSFLIDGNGLPLAFTTTPAHHHDIRSALPTVDRVRVGNRTRRPKRLRADKGYDAVSFRKALRHRGIKPAIDHREYHTHLRPERQWNDSKEIRYAPHRWKVEQRIACVDQNRRLDFLYERTREAYEGFLTLAMVRCYLKRLTK